MEEAKPKFNWQRLAITLGLVFFAAGAVGGSTYYVMGVQQKTEKDAYEKQIQELEEQRNQEKKKTEENTDGDNTSATQGQSNSSETTSWKSYVNSTYKYSIKYPTTWVYKEYGGATRVDALDVVFAKTLTEFPPDQSDAPAPIKISLFEEDNCCSGQGIKSETVTVAGKKATKYTVPANIPDRFGGWAEVWYVVPYYNSFIAIQNNNNYELSTFNKMVTTLSFY